MTWAPFAKSPNCASHNTKVSGSDREYPNSKPKTANSDKKLSIISNFFDSFQYYLMEHICRDYPDF